MTTTYNNNNNSYNYPPPPLPEGYHHSRQTTDSTQYSSSQAPFTTYPDKPYPNHTDTSNMPIRLPPDNNNHPHHHHRSVLDESQEELTEDERIAYEDGLITWEKAKQWRFWFRKEWTWYYVALVLLIIVVALMAIFHHSVSLSPAKEAYLAVTPEKIYDLQATWLIRSDHRLAHTVYKETAEYTRRMVDTSRNIVRSEFPTSIREW